MRRHAIVLLLVTFTWFAATLIAAMSLASSGSGQALAKLGNSITFISCILQMFCGAVGSKFAACRRGNSDAYALALQVRKVNVVAFIVMAVAAVLSLLEGAGVIGSLVSASAAVDPLAAFTRSPIGILSRMTCAGLVAGAILHANMVIQAMRIIAMRHRERRRQREHANSAAPIVVVVDDGRRVHLADDQTPTDNHVYVMYHGTRPVHADDIERYGFLPSKDGMLGAGVYLSRDITKAAHYPLDVPVGTQQDRTILECLVDVGKVKRIDCRPV